MYRLLNVGGNAKTVKGDKQGVYKTAILYLAPSNMAGSKINLCPKASEGCRSACLYNSGHAIAYPMVNQARVRKTIAFIQNRDWFLNDLSVDMDRFVRVCKKHGVKPCVRLNGTSDILWERIPFRKDGNEYINVMAAYPMVQFYDYTKFPNRKVPSNYHLTFSRSETNDEDTLLAIENGYNIAVVFRKGKKEAYPENYWGLRIIDGDETDLRFQDEKNVVVGLRAKGVGRNDQSGFVHEINKIYERPEKTEIKYKEDERKVNVN